MHVRQIFRNKQIKIKTLYGSFLTLHCDVLPFDSMSEYIFMALNTYITILIHSIMFNGSLVYYCVESSSDFISLHSYVSWLLLYFV